MEIVIIIAVAGAVGGLIKSLVEQKGAVALPRIEIAQDGTKYIHLGGVANLAIDEIMKEITSKKILKKEQELRNSLQTSLDPA